MHPLFDSYRLDWVTVALCLSAVAVMEIAHPCRTGPSNVVLGNVANASDHAHTECVSLSQGMVTASVFNTANGRKLHSTQSGVTQSAHIRTAPDSISEIKSLASDVDLHCMLCWCFPALNVDWEVQLVTTCRRHQTVLVWRESSRWYAILQI